MSNQYPSPLTQISLKKTLLCLPFLLSIAMLFAQVSFAAPGDKANESIAKPNDSDVAIRATDKDLSDLQPKLTELEKKMLDMHSEISTINETLEIQEQFLTLSQKKNKLEEHFHLLKVDSKKNSQQLNELQNELQVIERSLLAAADTLNQDIATLDQWLDFWSTEEGKLDQWHEGLGASSSLPIVIKKLKKMQGTVDQARVDIDSHLTPLLLLQEKSGRIQVAGYKLHLQVESLFKDRYQRGIYSHAPPFFSREFTDQFNSKLWRDCLKGIILILQPDTKYLFKEKTLITLSVFFFLLIYGVFYSCKQYLHGSEQLLFVSRRPISISIFLTILFFLTFTANPPQFWIALFRAISLITVIRISRAIIADSAQKSSVTRLALVLLVTDLLVMVNLPMPLMRSYLLFVSLVFIIFLLAKEKETRKHASQVRKFFWIRRVALFFLLAVLLAEISGQADLAFFIFSASLKTFYTGLFIWILYLLLLATIAIALHYVPFSLIKKNTDKITTMIRPVVIACSLLSFLVYSLVCWRLFPTATNAAVYISSIGFTYNEIHISLGVCITAGLFLYASLCLSRMIQATLLQSVLPQQNIDKGLQLSITKLLHYAIMLVGFLLALGALGFSLTNLTILGGALGVGIGFGLQEIIKNFACGLILLFERPIKLGDVIEVGEEMAVVKELGLRATVVETFDKAEIVLPNSDLITGPVTNWTLKERQARIRIPVGVAYSSNVEQVQQILQQCAEEHPLVLSTPKPRALFLAFGSSSLDFELRAFIANFNDRRLVQSEINLAINDAFSDVGIEIPFPQSDLHLRSVEPAATSILGTK